MTRSSLLLSLVLFPTVSFAAPIQLPVQGELTDTAGALVDGPRTITFSLYSSQNGAAPVWRSAAKSVPVHKGAFTAYLGDVGDATLDSALFRDTPTLWLTMQVAGDSESTRIRFGSAAAAAFAVHASDSAQLGGASRSAFAEWADLPAWLSTFDPSQIVSSWLELEDIPAEFADGTDDGFTTEGELTTLLNDNYKPASYVPGWAELTGVPAGFADNRDDGFTTEGELTALLNDNYLPAGWAPAWANLLNVPPEFADGSDDGFTTEGELTALLNDNYKPASYVPGWGDLTSVPAGFADNVDDNTQYTAGAGLTLNGTAFSVNQTTVEGWVRAASYDTEAELTAALNDNYKAASYAPSWSEVTGVPTGFADGQDNGFTTEADLTALLNDNYKPASYVPGWSELTGVPAPFADGVDNDTQYTAGTGLSLASGTFTVVQATIEGWVEDFLFFTGIDLSPDTTIGGEAVARGGLTCGYGYYVSGIDSAGAIVCSAIDKRVYGTFNSASCYKSSLVTSTSTASIYPNGVNLGTVACNGGVPLINPITITTHGGNLRVHFDTLAAAQIRSGDSVGSNVVVKPVVDGTIKSECGEINLYYPNVSGIMNNTASIQCDIILSGLGAGTHTVSMVSDMTGSTVVGTVGLYPGTGAMAFPNTGERGAWFVEELP